MPADLGLYLHWPFCQAKCPYCDFNSHVVASIDQQAWANAYVAEIARYGALTQGRIVRSVFFGGGTPSLMEPLVVDQVLTAIRRTWNVTNSWEVTLEANPTSVEAGRFREYRAAGVNRVSMGIQALNDDDLRRLGRMHSVAEARAAFDIARATFDRVSFDLIYARQDQTLADWQVELTQALSMAVDHLSLYQLTIEPGTAFGDRFARGGLRGLPGEDLQADMYELTQQLTTSSGMPAYEISNHAAPDAQSVHNMIYWTGGDYVGIGPGAHGRLTLDRTRWATEAVSAPMAWLKALNTPDIESWEALSHPDQLTEYLLMGLRISDGVSLARLQELGAPQSLMRNTASLVDDGLLYTSGDQLRTTDAGRPLLNGVLRQLLAD